MICGVGLDVCEIRRMEKRAEDERFLSRFFTEQERAYIAGRGAGAAQTLAGLFAAKEAFAKALGTGIAFDLREAEIVHDALGRPGYRLRGRAAELAGAAELAAAVPSVFSVQPRWEHPAACKTSWGQPLCYLSSFQCANVALHYAPCCPPSPASALRWRSGRWARWGRPC